ncbi:hypothetical protein CLF_105281 [Clonorchis sinensis]|uniref:Uncharacterized protein n=1 Tax=Clonorchis sinensis TaxID=79923 RepID=G7YP68_CLOSI|nr:hypothetical protein CLF_105281 [Clonorchis sinensis]
MERVDIFVGYSLLVEAFLCCAKANDVQKPPHHALLKEDSNLFCYSWTMGLSSDCLHTDALLLTGDVNSDWRRNFWNPTAKTKRLDSKGAHHLRRDITGELSTHWQCSHAIDVRRQELNFQDDLVCPFPLTRDESGSHVQRVSSHSSVVTPLGVENELSVRNLAAMLAEGRSGDETLVDTSRDAEVFSKTADIAVSNERISGETVYKKAIRRMTEDISLLPRQQGDMQYIFHQIAFSKRWAVVSSLSYVNELPSQSTQKTHTNCFTLINVHLRRLHLMAKCLNFRKQKSEFRVLRIFIYTRVIRAEEFSARRQVKNKASRNYRFYRLRQFHFIINLCLVIIKLTINRRNRNRNKKGSDIQPNIQANPVEQSKRVLMRGNNAEDPAATLRQFKHRHVLKTPNYQRSSIDPGKHLTMDFGSAIRTAHATRPLNTIIAVIIISIIKLIWSVVISSKNTEITSTESEYHGVVWLVIQRFVSQFYQSPNLPVWSGQTCVKFCPPVWHRFVGSLMKINRVRFTMHSACTEIAKRLKTREICR